MKRAEMKGGAPLEPLSGKCSVGSPLHLSPRLPTQRFPLSCQLKASTPRRKHNSGWPQVSKGSVLGLLLTTDYLLLSTTYWPQVSKGGVLGGGDEDAIQKALLASGPITIGINASPMQRYTGGIDNPLFCTKASLDHAVTIVGYGTEGGKDYWKIKKRVEGRIEP